MISLTTKKKVREHFDLASPYYQKLWGVHIHHGYYVTGKESKGIAQENLMQFIAEKLEIKPKSKVLDIGCGIGGTTIWLHKNYSCETVGITVSSNQVEMAKKNVKSLGIKSRFFVDDADDLQIVGSFDYVFAIEVLSHLHNRDNFFKKISKLLKPGGRIVIGAWQRDVALTKNQFDKYIKPINDGMMVSLPTFPDYLDQFNRHDFRLLSYSDLNDKVRKTWDIGSDIIRKKDLWLLASQHSSHFIGFLKAFQAMRKGYASGAFRYGIIVAEKL